MHRRPGKEQNQEALTLLLVLAAIEAKRQEVAAEVLLWWIWADGAKTPKNPAKEKALNNDGTRLGERGWATTDHLGSVTQVTDGSANVVWSSEYQPFGKTAGVEGLYDFDGSYAGHQVDKDTGLIYMWNRWQDPETGRFISEDPAQDGNNFYAYAGNSPLVNWDPTGLDSTPGTETHGANSVGPATDSPSAPSAPSAPSTPSTPAPSKGGQTQSPTSSYGGGPSTAPVGHYSGTPVKQASADILDILKLAPVLSRINPLWGIVGILGVLTSGEGDPDSVTPISVEPTKAEPDKTTVKGNKLPIKGRPNTEVTLVDSDGNPIQTRTYGPDGRAVKDTDYTDHGNPATHPTVPHEHTWDWSSGIPTRQ